MAKQSPVLNSLRIQQIIRRQFNTFYCDCRGAGPRIRICRVPSANAAGAHPPPESEGGWRSLVRTNARPDAAERTEVRKKAGLDIDRIWEAWTYAATFGIDQSLLVIRDGWIAAEWNYAGAAPVNSCTKSLTGLALAKLFELSDAGKTPKKIGYDAEIWQYLPAAWSQAEPGRKRIKVKHLPTMCSGLPRRAMGCQSCTRSISAEASAGQVPG